MRTKSIFFSAAFGLAMACASCGNNQTETNTHEAHATEYACPMKCEGDKTYSDEGACPVCGMDLIEVD